MSTPFPLSIFCIMPDGKSRIHYFLIASNLAPRIHQLPYVDVHSGEVPPPHYPVSIRLRAQDKPMWCLVPDEPKAFAVLPPVGCARFPYPWHRVRAFFDRAAARDCHAVAAEELLSREQNGKSGGHTDASQLSPDDPLSQLWDVLQGVDVETAGLYDKVDGAARRSVGRDGPPCFQRQLLRWERPRRRRYADEGTQAWATAKRWA